jgi:two-component system, NtrC family, response regulator AtoC
MTPVKIMIVEDERITAADLQDTIAQLGYTVTATVSTGADAVREAGRNPPDLVVMDISIGGDVDGVEAAKRLRRQFDIPVVYLTAHADPDTLSRAMGAEPLGYILKPFQERGLHAVIETAVHKHQADREARRRQDLMLEAAGIIRDGLIFVDGNGLVKFINPAAELLTGWKKHDVLGRHFEEVLRLKPACELQAIGRAFSAGTLATLADTSALITRDGQERQIAGSMAQTRDHNGAIMGAVFILNHAKAAPAHADEETAATTTAKPQMVMESEEMKQLVHFTQRIAASEISTVIIEGESGSGKDVLARYLHSQSNRRTNPFLAISCAAIPETLLESELFGYEKGAFTDARQQKKGIFELASGGTLFLDEIGDMPLPLQAKLLRVLEEQSLRRVGGIKDIRIDLRVLAATNKDLSEAIRDGRFRLDLYHRLSVICLRVPPLRQRKEDILPLVNHFLQVFNPRFKRRIMGVSPRATQTLLAYDWPGNVRELRNVIERTMVLEQTSWIQLSSLGMQFDLHHRTSVELRQGPLETGTMSLEKTEIAMLLRALEQAGWNQTRAAGILGITRDTLRYKVKKFGLKQTESAPRTQQRSVN